MKFILSLGFFGILLAVAIVVVLAISGWYQDLDATQQQAIIGAVALLAVPLVTFFTTKSLERRRAISQATFGKRVEIYESFIEFFMKLLLQKDADKVISENEIIEFIKSFTPNLMTYGSNSVIQKWGRFRVDMEKLGQNDPKKLLVAFEDLIKAMRKDLGHADWGLQEGDLARLFVNDIDEALKKSKQE